MKRIFLMIPFLAVQLCTMAQDSTNRKKEVKITSTFKPQLKEAAKINFNASPPVADSSRPRLQYSLPNQNLLFGFQPGSLRPLALQVDSLGAWNNESYVKLGYGNLKSPYIQAGLSLGDGKTTGINLYARHISAEGKRAYQEFSNSNLDLSGYVRTGKNLEWTGRFGGEQEKYYRYGFEPQTLQVSEDSLLARYQTWRGRIGFHNLSPTAYGISYAPEVRIDIFNDNRSNTESNTRVHLPLKKTLGPAFEVDLSLTANLSRYKPEEKEVINNNFVSITPSVLYRKPNLFIRAGINPSWDNGEFKLFPSVHAEVATTDKRFTVQAGWIGYLRNAGFQYLAGFNPYIWAPQAVFNTRIEERYAGFKGSIGDHFTYSAKIAGNVLNNQPLFTNDTSAAGGGQAFVVLNEPKMKQLHIGGELGYNVGEKFSVVSNLAFNQYMGLERHRKAYGLLPIEFKTTMRLQVLRDLYVNADVFAFDGPRFIRKDGDLGNVQGAIDMSAGLEFRVVRHIKLWAQFNNVFNNPYERWDQYPVYGFNILGGVVFSFAQNNK